MNLKLKTYGSRGSISFFNREALRSGGNTTCYKLEMNGHTIIFDCGTGIMQFHADIANGTPKPQNGRNLTFDIFISHLHLDHIIGLSMFDFLFDKTNNIRIFTRSRSELPLESQVFNIFKPPYWPIDIEQMSNAQIIEIKGGDSINITDEITVKVFDSMHDNATTSFRVEGENTMVYLLDYEIKETSHSLPSLVDFCKDADVVVFDASYLPEDYPPRKGWGHSTYEAGMMLAEMSGCKRMVLSHFFHIYTDKILDIITERVSKVRKNDDIEYIIARDGLELEF